MSLIKVVIGSLLLFACGTTPLPTGSTTTRVSSTTAPNSAPTAACLDHSLGLDPDGGLVGPVIACADAFFGSDDFIASAVVRAGTYENAEAAFAGLATGLKMGSAGIDDDGYLSLIPSDWGGEFTITQEGDGVVTVDISEELLAVSGLSTTTNSTILFGQLFGTAFSDLSVQQVTITVAGSTASFCGLLQFRLDCATLHRSDFFR